MGDLTKNISRHEVACKCGCGEDTIDWVTVTLVQLACDHFADQLGLSRVVLNIHSGMRCLEYNIQERGTLHSKHLTGRALDHSINGVSTMDLFKYYSSCNNMYGVGLYLYDGFVHFDSRSNEAARWEG